MEFKMAKNGDEKSPIPQPNRDGMRGTFITEEKRNSTWEGPTKKETNYVPAPDGPPPRKK
jgi:hypothetical protein